MRRRRSDQGRNIAAAHLSEAKRIAQQNRTLVLGSDGRYHGPEVSAESAAATERWLALREGLESLCRIDTDPASLIDCVPHYQHKNLRPGSPKPSPSSPISTKSGKELTMRDPVMSTLREAVRVQKSAMPSKSSAMPACVRLPVSSAPCTRAMCTTWVSDSPKTP